MRARCVVASSWLAGLAGGCGATFDGGGGEIAPPALVCDPDDSRALYDKRIAPLLAEERPSSCNACHLSGVDLGLYARDSPCRTMACMVEKGVVDLDDPQRSLILQWILRADPSSPLVTEQMIQEEHDGMLEWIQHVAACGSEVCEPIDDPCGAPPSWEDCPLPPPEGPPPFVDPGDCSDRTIEAVFAGKVYPWRGRCYPCHFDDYDGDVEAPRWIHVGPCEEGSVVTMHNVLERGLADLDDPAQSLLLLKPLAVASGGVPHGGHDKIADTNDETYRDFLYWLSRLAQCRAP